MTRRAAYQQYLQSAHWGVTRQRRLDVAGHRCEFRPEEDDGNMKHTWLGERCAATTHLDVHHRRYDTLGKERDADLEVLCRFHHLVRHASHYECPTCCDSWAVLDSDAIDAVEQAIEDAGGDVRDVTPEQVFDHISCSYCNR